MPFGLIAAWILSLPSKEVNLTGSTSSQYQVFKFRDKDVFEKIQSAPGEFFRQKILDTFPLTEKRSREITLELKLNRATVGLMRCGENGFVLLWEL
ncbi:hypothetical protein TNCV_102841 [Trichonephila clavipes]|nr:hypothetical protein TNCV_102841 [Trichonephila clavipes]